ncbi:polo-like kinase 3, partial [Mortierella sp. 14UC]
VRSNAAYTVGALCQNTTLDISSYYPSLLTALYPLFQGQNLDNVTDNACGAVARMVMRHPDVAPADQILPVFIFEEVLSKEDELKPHTRQEMIELIRVLNTEIPALNIATSGLAPYLHFNAAPLDPKLPVPALDSNVPIPAEQPPVHNPPPLLDIIPHNGGYILFDAMPFIDIPLDALLEGDMFFHQNVADGGHDQGVAAVQASTDIGDLQGQEFTDFIEQPMVNFFMDKVTGAMYMENRQETLGQGTFGCVHEVTDVNGVKMALKMPTRSTRADIVAHEVNILNRLNDHKGHRNVVTFHGTINDVSGTGLLFDLYHTRDFWELLCTRGALLEEECRYYGKQLINGLAFIHERGVLHCDLKPNNILVASGMVLKICDFGMAEDLNEQDKIPFSNKTSAPGFVAPEIVKFGKHTPALDVFSLGWYCPSSMPESAFEEPPTFPHNEKRQSGGGCTCGDEGHQVKKLRHKDKGKAVIREHVEAAEGYHVKVEDVEAMSEEIRELSEKKAKLQEMFGDGI